jgi:3-oxoadipate enol-lactonase
VTARLERLRTGAGSPVTVFAHGLAAGIADTRPLGSAVAGTRVFFQFRGHGGSAAPPGDWSFADLADDLSRVAAECSATRAVGVSLGAGALCRLLATEPARFQRLVFFLPAALSTPPQPESRDRLARLIAALGTGAPEPVLAVLGDDVPDLPGAASYLRQRAADLLARPLAAQLLGLLDDTPCPDPSVLSRVEAPALIIAARGEPRHPVPVAEQLAAALGNASLHVYQQPHPLWSARADVRSRISGFLNAP